MSNIKIPITLCSDIFKAVELSLLTWVCDNCTNDTNHCKIDILLRYNDMSSNNRRKKKFLYRNHTYCECVVFSPNNRILQIKIKIQPFKSNGK